MKTSYSALDTFLQCPLKYKFQEIDKIRAPKSKEAVFGTAIHSALNFYHQPGRLTPPKTSEVLEKFTSSWKSEVFNDQFTQEAMFNEGRAILEKYCEKNNPEKVSPLTLELFFKAPIGDEHILSGKIDRVDKTGDDSFEIIDYKTSRRLPSQEDVDSNLQLAIYQLGFINQWPDFNKSIKVSLYFIRHGVKISSQLTEENINRTKDKVLDIISQIEEAAEKNKFDPLPCPLCDWCGHQKNCPMFSHKFKKDALSAEEIDIQKVLREFLELRESEQKMEERLKELKEQINLYCDSQKVERVFSDLGPSVSRSIQQRFDYDWNVVSDVLKKNKKWEDVFEPNTAKLKKIMPSLPDEDFKKIEKTRRVESEWKVIKVDRPSLKATDDKKET